MITFLVVTALVFGAVYLYLRSRPRRVTKILFEFDPPQPRRQ